MPWLATAPRRMPPRRPVIKAAEDSILAAADAAVPAVTAAIAQSITATQRVLTLTRLTPWLLAGNVSALARVVEDTWEEYGAAVLATTVPPLLTDVALAVAAQTTIQGVQVVFKALAVGLEPIFGVTAPEVLAAVETEVGLQITAISDTTRGAVRGIIRTSLESGQGVQAMAREIRQVVGLTPRQAASVARYRQGLTEAGMPSARIQALGERRAAASQKERALTIARTETLRAANAGQYAIWKIGAQQGALVVEGMRRFWLITASETCAICRAIATRHAEGLLLNQPFQSANGPLLYPPAHPRCRCTTILKPLPGNLRSFLTPPPLEIPALPVIDAAKATKTFLADLGGTTGAKKYRGSDRVVRVIKQPTDPVQAYAEGVTNRLYRMLGVDAPESSFVMRDGQLVGLGNKFVPGMTTLKEAGVTPARAKRLTQDLVADVWLANRDVMGLHLDNILVKGTRLLRSDQGAALNFRAQGSRKPAAQLDQLIEWQGFFDPRINASYARVAKAAGLPNANALGQRALEQIDHITTLGRRSHGFADLFPEIGGVSATERQGMIDMLRARARALEAQIRPQIEAYLHQPPHEVAMRALMGESEFTAMVRNAEQALGTGTRYNLTDAELAAVHAYTTEHAQWSYHATNGALRNPRQAAERERLMPLIETTTAGLAKLPGYTGKVYRGTDRLPTAFVTAHKVGEEIKYAAFTSTSGANESAFGGRYRYIIEAKGGARDVEPLSAFKRERERLFAPDTTFHVLDVQSDANHTIFYLREVPRTEMSKTLSPEDAQLLREMKQAAAEMFTAEAALTPEELAAVQAEWAPFRAKVESGAIAVPADEISPYEASRREWLQQQQ